MTGPLFRIMGLWGRQTGWLLAGLFVSLAALVAGIGLMAVSGLTIGAAILAGGLAMPVVLRGFGGARVALRYAERLVTHGATFRALADLRVWFFGRLARTSAGGLGFRQAGDVLARLVGDVEALDGLYLRILLPLSGAVLLLPVLVLLIGHRAPGLATEIGVLFAAAAFVLPWLAARASARTGSGLAVEAGALRIAALDALTGLREVRAFAAEGRMLATVQAREAALLSAQRGMADRTALAGAASFLCAQIAVLAVLIDAGASPAAAIAGAFLVLASFEAVGPCRGARGPRLGRRATRAGSRRCARASARPRRSGCHAGRDGAAVRKRRVPLAARSAAGFRRPDSRYSTRRARGPAGAVRLRQINAGGARTQGGGTPLGADPPRRGGYRDAAGRSGPSADRLAGANDASL